MADPLSATGSVVGIVSLGITLCTGLISYIEDVKGAKEKAEQIATESGHLSDVLELLENVVGKANTTPTISVTRSSVIACATAIDRIRERLEQVNRRKQPGFRACLDDIKERLCFPFKQADVLYWKNVLRDVQQSLHTALLVLQIDQQQADFEDVKRLITQEAQSIQAGYQSLKLREQHHLEEQIQVMRATSQSSSRQLTSRQASVGPIQQDLTPIFESTTQTSDTLAAVVSSLGRLEHQVNTLTLSSLSPSSIETDLSDHRHLCRDIRRLKSYLGRKNRTTPSCHCQQRSETSVYLRWPFFLSRKRTIVHESYCSHAVWEQALTDINLRVSFCSLALKRKFDFSVFLLHLNGGEVQIKPALTIRRIVSDSSPAFELLERFILYSDASLDAAENATNELLRLFQERKATPYDRLDDGRTLLHYFMGYSHMPRRTTPDIVKRLLEHMPHAAHERDDHNRTCLDFVISGRCTFDMQATSLLLEHDVRFSLESLDCYIDVLPHLGRLRLDDYPLSLPEGDEVVEMILRKSEVGLQHTLNTRTHICPRYGTYLLELTTGIGWTQGCEILFQDRLIRPKELQKHEYFKGPVLLTRAIFPRNISTLEFWLNAREKATRDELACIGTLQTALEAITRDVLYCNALEGITRDVLYWNGSAKRIDAWYTPVVSALVRERLQLQALVETHGIQGQCYGHEDRLLDAHAWCAMSHLFAAGVNVHCSLRHLPHSIYCCEHPLTLETMDTLYEAGFRDISATDFICSRHTPISPLLHIVTLTSLRLQEERINYFDWFLSKGADALERWPDSTVTALHCLGWQVGLRWQFPGAYSLSIPKFFCLLARSDTDGCACACSLYGCLFMTCWGKGLGRESNVDLLKLWRKARAVWIEGVAVGTETRWLVTAFIRFLIFDALDIRHTCCDIARIQHSGNPNTNISPTPRYSPTTLQRIQKEDAFLVDLLEELIPAFDAEYDAFDGDPQAFVTNHLEPKLEKILNDIRRRDTEQYAQGRRELGVVMELGNDGGEEEDDTDDAANDDEYEESSEDEV